MKKIRFLIALWASKLSRFLLRLLGRSATNFPGIVALRICPDFLAVIQKPKRVIGISGTNGKTTTSNLIHDLLEALSGRPVLNNSKGSNIDTGVASALSEGVSLFGKPRYETAVLEIDERSAARILPKVRPSLMLVTNLSRDSIMRNAHPAFIRDFMSAYMPPDTFLLLNADDILSSGIAPDNPRAYYAIGPMEGDKKESQNLLQDVRICPECHHRISYAYARYASTGRIQCQSCGFSSPRPDYEAREVSREKGTFLFHAPSGAEQLFPFIHDSVFNLYNETAAIALLCHLGYDLAGIREALAKTHVAKSRYDDIEEGSHHIIRIFCKGLNAYAESRVFEYLAENPEPKELLMLNNCREDAEHWSENVCWLYDTDFELLKDMNVEQIVLYGSRKYDFKLRLLLAGIPEEKIYFTDTLEQTPDALLLTKGTSIYVLYEAGSIELAAAQIPRIRQLIQKKEAAV